MTDQSNSPAGTVDGRGERTRLTEEAVAHAAARGISRATLVKLGVSSATAFFPAIEKKCKALVFPYTINGLPVGKKAVAFPDKAFMAKKDVETLPFFNLDRVLNAPPGEVFLTEGEFDTAAMIEAGLPLERVLSVPTGAGPKPGGGEPPEEITRVGGSNDRRYAFGYVGDALKAGLGKHTKFVWCGDSDDVGLALRDRMARMLGVGKFWFVEWPEGIKDANEMLLKEGASALMDLVVHGAKPWPVSGLYRLSEIPEPPPRTVWDTGFGSWSSKIHVADSTLCVVTGQPGAGKTLMMAQLWFQVLDRYNLTAVISTFETQANPEYRRILRTLHSGKLEVLMSAPEIAAADRWINEHILWMEHPDRRPTLEWLLDTAEAAVVRHNAKIVLIDPWNRVEATREDREREDEYVSRCLRACHAFAQDMKVCFQIIAHPSKMDSQRRASRSEPMLEDISGAKHWDNMPDQGLVIHRPHRFDDETGKLNCEATVTHAKARFPALGYDCRMKVVFDRATGRFMDLMP